MLPATSLLRKLPACINSRQSLEIDAFVLATDVITANYRTLVEVATRIGDDVDKVTDADRVRMIAAAWAMVDNVHAIRQLARTMFPGPIGTAFLAKYEAATHLRNRMDHLADQIPNLAAAKIARPPIFGVLSYFATGPITKHTDGKRTVKSGRTMLLMAGSFTHTKHKFDSPNPLGRQIRLPVSLFHFQAFDYTLEFDELVSDLQNLANRADEKISAAIEKLLNEKSKELSMPVEKLREPRGGGLRLALEIEFEPTALAEERA